MDVIDFEKKKNCTPNSKYILKKFDLSLIKVLLTFSSGQFSSVAQLCPTLCDPMDYSMPGVPVHHQLLEFTQTHVH